MTSSGQPQEETTPRRIEDIWAQLQKEAAARGVIAPEEIRRRYPDIADELIDVVEMDRRMQAASSLLRNNAADGDASRDERALIQSALPLFHILAEIGRGGQGVVFKAVQRSTGRVVALKVIYALSGTDPIRRQRFAREIEIVSCLRHPNIVALYESGTVLGRPYYAMEFIEGMPIDEYVTCVNRPAIEERVRIFLKVCRAMAYAHQRGVIHRDLKPSNTLVDLDDEPYVLDFGLAKDLDSGGPQSAETAVSVTGFAFGTLPYSSPEQANGRMHEVDTRSDIYSLGVVLFKLLTGALPYSVAGRREEVCARIAHDPPQIFRKALVEAEIEQYPPGTELPDDLEQIARKALAKEPARRYQSADALAEDLDRFLAGQAVSAKADSAFYILTKALRRYKIQVSVAAAFVLLLLGSLAGMTALWQRSDRLARMYQKGLEAGAFLRLGAVERDEGRVEKAIEMLEQSLAITEAMSPASDEIIEFKCSAFMQLSEMYLGRSDLEQARRFAASARVAVDGALNRDSNALIWNRLDGACHRLSGRVNLALGKYRVAIEEFNASLSIREELLKAIPNDSSVEDDVAGVCRYLGQSYRLLGESDLAGTYYRRACEIRRRLYSADPDSVERNVNLCHAENSLAAWYMSLESADDDDLADALLQVVQVRISALERSDRSRTLSREADDLQDTVRRNLAVLARRRESGYGPN